MKTETIVLLAASAGVAGLAVQEFAPLPIVTGKGIIPAVAGLAVAVGGYMLDMDGVADGVEALGVGLVAGAIL